jgi:hypothetical protein
MLIDKGDLLKLLRTVATFDTNASPYVAIQLVDDGLPRFYRSSNFGFIQSKDFGVTKQTYISLSHFQDCLKVLGEEKVQIALDANGIVKIYSTDNTFESELRIHTVPATQAGLKHHDIGDIKMRLEPLALAGINTSPFKVATPPVLVNGKLMLATANGIVMWQGPDTLRTIQLQPRDAFLRLVAGSSAVEELVLTEKGYWGVVIAGLLFFISGHNIGRPLFDVYNVPGVELARLPAQRLVFALGAAAALCSDNDRVELDPVDGVMTRDKFGNDSKFSLGAATGWTKFATFGKTAKTLVDALSQSKDEEAVLEKLTSTHPTMRLRRGNFEVSFKVF